ncbi:hypothetical protein C8R45DRAFT_1216543 [Mycena sanguinolenta]|nr:hypothetical protein C8R45DRAFT_1216543 [Mycena sanguinolenta]
MQALYFSRVDDDPRSGSSILDPDGHFGASRSNYAYANRHPTPVTSNPSTCVVPSRAGGTLASVFSRRTGETASTAILSNHYTRSSVAAHLARAYFSIAPVTPHPSVHAPHCPSPAPAFSTYMMRAYDLAPRPRLQHQAPCRSSAGAVFSGASPSVHSPTAYIAFFASCSSPKYHLHHYLRAQRSLFFIATVSPRYFPGLPSMESDAHPKHQEAIVAHPQCPSVAQLAARPPCGTSPSSTPPVPASLERPRRYAPYHRQRDARGLRPPRRPCRVFALRDILDLPMILTPRRPRLLRASVPPATRPASAAHATVASHRQRRLRRLIHYPHRSARTVGRIPDTTPMSPAPASAALHRARRVQDLPARPGHPQRRPNPSLKT